MKKRQSMDIEKKNKPPSTKYPMHENVPFYPIAAWAAFTLAAIFTHLILKWDIMALFHKLSFGVSFILCVVFFVISYISNVHSGNKRWVRTLAILSFLAMIICIITNATLYFTHA